MATLDIINERLAIVTLVSEDEVKINTPIEANKAQSTIIPHIQVSQDLHICKNLGQILYDKLLAEWVANLEVADDLPDGTPGGTPPIILGDTTDYKTLYKKCFKPLVWWSFTLALSSMAIKASEAGLLFRSTENAESAGLEGLKKLVAESEATARSYTEMLITYIDGLKCTADDIASDSTKVGAASVGVFVPRKPWHHGNNKNY
jgi:hypothetical protein